MRFFGSVIWIAAVYAIWPILLVVWMLVMVGDGFYSIYKSIK